MTKTRYTGLKIKNDGSLNGKLNVEIQGKFIELNGERYVKVRELRPSEVVTAKLMEYVESVNIKHASLEEIEVLLKIHRTVY